MIMPVMVVLLVRVTAGLGAIARTEKGPSMRQYGNTREPINAIAATTSSVLSARVPRGRGAGTQSTALPLALALAHWHWHWQQVRHSAAKGARPPPPPTGCPTHPSENYREEIISRSESQCVGTGSAILTEFRRRGKHGGEHSEPKKRPRATLQVLQVLPRFSWMRPWVLPHPASHATTETKK